MKIHDTRARSLSKAISWRVCGTVISWVATFYVTGSLTAATSVGAIDAIAKVLLYYLHERAWEKISLSDLYKFAKKREG